MASALRAGESYQCTIQVNPGVSKSRHFESFDKMCEFATRLKNDSVPLRSTFKACLVVQRSGSYKNYIGDLLFPNFIHTSLRAHNFAMRFLSGLFTIPLDLLTLIPRLIGTIFALKAKEVDTVKEFSKDFPQGTMTVKFYGECKYTPVVGLPVVKKVEGVMTVALRPLDKEVFTSKFKYTCNVGLQKGEKTLSAEGLVKELDSSLGTTAIESKTLDAPTWQMIG